MIEAQQVIADVAKEFSGRYITPEEKARTIMLALCQAGYLVLSKDMIVRLIERTAPRDG